MATLLPANRVSGLRFSAGKLVVLLADGREVRIPLAFYPTLAKAKPQQRNDWELIGPDKGFHWRQLDLDLSVDGLIDLFDILAPELDAHGGIAIGGKDVQGVAAHAKVPAGEVLIVALVIDLGQVAQQGIAAVGAAHTQVHHSLVELLR